MLVSTLVDSGQPTLRPILARALALACFATAAFGCSNTTTPSTPASPANAADTTPPESAGTIADAYAALVAADYAALPDLIARLDADLERDPEQGRVAFYGGVMRLWRATGGTRQLGEMFTDVTTAIKLLEQARKLRPQDAHAGAFLGVAQVALGNVAGDDERIALGRRILEETVPLYPPYVNGVLAQALGMLPKAHPFFADATPTIHEIYVACGNTESQLEALTFDYPDAQPLGTCWNGGIVAHVWEGISLIAGDIWVKRGDAEGARHLYENAKASPTYDRWPFQEELDRRIADAEARKALYLDDDPENDPPTWMQEQNLCVGCHANKR